MPSFKAVKPSEPRQSIVKPGKYKLEIMSASDSVSKAGNEVIELKLEAAMPDGSKGPIIYENLVFSEKVFWKIQEFLTSIGNKIEEGQDVEVDSEDLIGRTCEAVLFVEEYNGNERMKVKRWLPEPQRAVANDGLGF
jgi:hypothetical protein